MTFRIYEIRHPETGMPVYVGCTRLELTQRLRSHRHPGTSGTALVADWLAKQRRAPPIVLVATARTRASGERKEAAHIRRLADAGVQLLNRKGNPLVRPWQEHFSITGLGYACHPRPCAICDRARLDTLKRVG